jgi:hypothetical protein
VNFSGLKIMAETLTTPEKSDANSAKIDTLEIVKDDHSVKHEQSCQSTQPASQEPVTAEALSSCTGNAAVTAVTGMHMQARYQARLMSTFVILLFSRR